jgi:hypothetical protein
LLEAGAAEAEKAAGVPLDAVADRGRLKSKGKSPHGVRAFQIYTARDLNPQPSD